MHCPVSDSAKQKCKITFTIMKLLSTYKELTPMMKIMNLLLITKNQYMKRTSTVLAERTLLLWKAGLGPRPAVAWVALPSDWLPECGLGEGWDHCLLTTGIMDSHTILRGGWTFHLCNGRAKRVGQV